MMNTSLRVFQINASGKIVEISRQSSLESGTKLSLVAKQGCPAKPRMEIVHKKFPCGLQLSHMVHKSPIHETMLP